MIYFKYFPIYNLKQNVKNSDKKDFELYQVFVWENILVLPNCALLMY